MEEKCVKMQNPAHLWAKTHRVYRYRLSCNGTRMQRAISTGTAQTCTGTDWKWITCTGTAQTGNWYLLFQQPCFDMFSHR